MATIQTAVNYWPSRAAPPQMAGEVARGLEASGKVDWFQTWDQLVSFLPRALWREDVTPMARLTGDSDSFYNAGMIAAIAAAATEDLGITTTLDAVRNGPAEILQQTLTLAAATNGKAALQLGAGELKQCKPFGYKRSQGLSRMEDIFQIMRKLLDTEGLVSHEGRHWTYDRAWIGNHVTHQPTFWALGGGPKLMDIATSYADGFMSLVPSAFSTPEAWGEQVAALRAQLESKDRDPEAFTFGFWPFVVIYDTEEERDRLLEHDHVKWMAAVFGRLHHGDWAEEGIDLIFPEDWHYAMKLSPHTMSRDEVDGIVAQVTREMVEKSYYIGTPAEVAEQLRPFGEAGANFMAPCDMSPSVLTPAEQPRAWERVIELCGHLKGAS